MKISEVLSTISNRFDKIKFTPDGSLGYGILNGKRFHVMKSNYGPESLGYLEADTVTSRTTTFISYMFNVDKPCNVVLVFRNVEGSCMIYYVLSDEFKDVDCYNFEEELCPDGFSFLCAYSTIGGKYNMYRYMQLASTMCSFNNGSNNSVIPTCWRVDGPVDGLSTYDVFLNDTSFLFDENVFKDAITLIKKDLPPVDLETEPEKRFVVLDVGNDAYFMYNRNCIAYNGSSSYYSEFAPIVLWQMAAFYDSIGYENFLEFVAGEISADEVRISSKTYEEEEPSGWVPNAMPEPAVVKEDGPKKHEDNILLRAARASDTDYE